MNYIMLLFLCGSIQLTTSATCPGCDKQQDVTDPGLTELLVSALSEYTSLPKGTKNERTELVQVTRITTKVVSGILYTFDFEARGVTTHELYVCHLELLSKVWEKVKTVTKYTCQPATQHSTG